MTVDHPIYDAMYVAFALAIGASALIVADKPFARAMKARPDPAVASLVTLL